ncbi:MAG: CBS domain-containing protein [Deltaproteobacteria bacterium]|nr:CBS domain-containing protein [Deltaproteobacteria bacterium]
MLVKNWMSKDVITVDANDSMAHASQLMKENHIRGLPVMNNGKLAGVITDRDLKKASASDAHTLDIHELLYLIDRIKIKDIMTQDPITIPVDHTIEEAAEMLLNNKLSGAPVVNNDGQVVGIITQADIFRVLVSLTSAREKGLQFGFLLEDRPGSIKEVADIIRTYGCRVVSILSANGDHGNKRHVYIRACDCDRDRLEPLKAELKAKASPLYMVDRREDNKEIYQEYARPSATWITG